MTKCKVGYVFSITHHYNAAVQLDIKTCCTVVLIAFCVAFTYNQTFNFQP